jgi:hypothetical protein
MTRAGVDVASEPRRRMTDTELTSVVQQHGIAPLSSDIPNGMTMADYRASKALGNSRRGRARTAMRGLQLRVRRRLLS